jgi:hypothetical protein
MSEADKKAETNEKRRARPSPPGAVHEAALLTPGE